jgi:hypothetical protein
MYLTPEHPLLFGNSTVAEKNKCLRDAQLRRI